MERLASQQDSGGAFRQLSCPAVLPELHAVIGVRFAHGKTFYVRRSPQMENYPNVWSLFSIQFDPRVLDPEDLNQVQNLMDQMSLQRCGGVPVQVLNKLTSGTCLNNSIRRRVFLHLYLIYFDEEPKLNPRYYTEGTWLFPRDYVAKSKEAPCGLCTRLWSDYSYVHGLSEERFAPVPEETALEIF